MAHYRKIHLEGEVWRYHISGWYVVIRGPQNQRILTNQSELTGWSALALERAQWKGGAPAITPSMIKDFIEKSRSVA